eukprot:363818-Chlamydomonas_euryale.AAC.1
MVAPPPRQSARTLHRPHGRALERRTAPMRPAPTSNDLVASSIEILAVRQVSTCKAHICKPATCLLTGFRVKPGMQSRRKGGGTPPGMHSMRHGKGAPPVCTAGGRAEAHRPACTAGGTAEAHRTACTAGGAAEARRTACTAGGTAEARRLACTVAHLPACTAGRIAQASPILPTAAPAFQSTPPVQQAHAVHAG